MRKKPRAVVLLGLLTLAAPGCSVLLAEGTEDGVETPAAEAPAAPPPATYEPGRPPQAGVTPARQEARRADGKDARTLFERGVREFEAGNYAAAAATFEQCYRLTGAAPLLFNVAKCHERLRRFAAARTYYRLFLERHPSSPLRAQVLAHIDRLRSME